jgi:hypothetical protein
MDPATLAAGAVALLVPFLERIGGQLADQIGTDLGQAVVDKLGHLYERVRSRVAGDRFAEPALERLAARPESELRQAAFAEVLGELLDKDPSFAAELEALVEGARTAGGPAVAQIFDAGAVAIQGDVRMQGRYVAGRDMTVGDQEP